MDVKASNPNIRERVASAFSNCRLNPWQLALLALWAAWPWVAGRLLPGNIWAASLPIIVVLPAAFPVGELFAFLLPGLSTARELGVGLTVFLLGYLSLLGWRGRPVGATVPQTYPISMEFAWLSFAAGDLAFGALIIGCQYSLVLPKVRPPPPTLFGFSESDWAFLGGALTGFGGAATGILLACIALAFRGRRRLKLLLSLPALLYFAFHLSWVGYELLRK
ncbi:MAG TPA: hypothetical protein PKD73_06920 [Burkholderiaceae bacterium]|jgi:hypothetical protein|nr:hypothetical protein [Burkholderiaceae bacterium]